PSATRPSRRSSTRSARSKKPTARASGGGGSSICSTSRPKTSSASSGSRSSLRCSRITPSTTVSGRSGASGPSARRLISPYSGFLCTYPPIVSQTITGPDAAYYSLTYAASTLMQLDSDVIAFQPIQGRDYSATLIITLADGTEFRVQ